MGQEDRKPSPPTPAMPNTSHPKGDGSNPGAPIIPAMPKVDHSLERASQAGAEEKLRSDSRGGGPSQLKRVLDKRAAGGALAHPTHTTFSKDKP